ncbi:MAG: hypothetical protein KIS66_04480 [Fimbriimonadaceae bacterium]|nr:hypothetical protein [Fimbriimonadaceae bacterium]
MSNADPIKRISAALREIADALDSMARQADDEPVRSSAEGRGIATKLDPETVCSSPLPDAGPFMSPGIPLFLEANGVTIVQQRPAPDLGLIGIADFVAQKHATVSEFMQRLKRALNDGRTVSLDLSRRPQETIADVTMAATMMYRAGLLEEYRYERAPRCRLQCAPGRAPIAVAFITGSWLELHVLGTLRDLVDELAMQDRTDIGLGYQIRLPNGDQFELDICCLVDRGRLIWVEAKTGDNFNALLGKYASYRKSLKVASTDAVLCCPEFDSDSASRARAAVAEMVAAGISDIRALLRSRLSASA